MTTDQQGDVTRITEIVRKHLYDKLMQPKNLAKGHWNGCSDRQLLDLAWRESKELQEELIVCADADQNGKLLREDIVKALVEACDAVVFPAMLLDNFDRRVECLNARSVDALGTPQKLGNINGCDEGGPKGTTETPVERSLPSTTILPPRKIIFEGVFC